jgi:Zn-dependent oligopeptidase
VVPHRYEQLLHVRIVPVPAAPVWSDDVTCFAVVDASPAPAETDALPGYPGRASHARGADEALLGYFYLDLAPREGKYAHQCVVPIAPTYRTLSGAPSVRTWAGPERRD